MSDTKCKEINRKLDLVVNLLATQIVQGKEYRDQVKLLDNVGLQPREIAKITGKSANNVNVTLHLIKKSKKGGKQNE